MRLTGRYNSLRLHVAEWHFSDVMPRTAECQRSAQSKLPKLNAFASSEYTNCFRNADTPSNR